MANTCDANPLFLSLIVCIGGEAAVVSVSCVVVVAPLEVTVTCGAGLRDGPPR